MRNPLTGALTALLALVSLGCWHAGAAVPNGNPAPNCVIETGTEAVEDGTIVYNTAGEGRVLLLLHGLFAAKEQWNELLCRMADAGYRAIAVDLPGYGKSSGFSLPDYRLERQAALLRLFTGQLGITHLDIAGSSMGGTIATLYVKRYPRQVGSLAFIGAPLGIIGWGNDLKRGLYRGVNAFIPINRNQFEFELGLLFVNPPTIPPPEQRAIITEYIEHNRHYVQVWDIVNLYDDVLRRDSLPRVPTLIVWGVEDRVYEAPGADTLHAALPDSVLHKLPNAGHLLLIENATEVAALYRAFLQDRGRPARH